MLKILDGDGGTRPQTGDYDVMKNALLLCSPVARLVSRNTRRQLREYARDNKLDGKLGTRSVSDVFVHMSSDERYIYDAVSEYISKVWKTRKNVNRAAVGFALVVYRKRLTSSLAALKATLENHLERLDGKTHTTTLSEDEYDDKDTEDIAKDEEGALRELDRKVVCHLLEMMRSMPHDTKLDRLTEVIAGLRNGDYKQVMVFTQFTDTMDFLRDRLGNDWKVMCYSGRQGEEPGPNGAWMPLSRDETKAKFMDGSVDVLICTDAAAEGLNFQFCGAMINYDMPWNPMRVEQRIGRIDRIGQKHDSIRIVNMYYEGTVEAKIYSILRKRINLFKDMVGSLQPILAKLDRLLTESLEGDDAVVRDVGQILDVSETDSSLELDSMLAAETTQYEPPKSPVTMDDLGRIASNAGLVPYKTESTGRGQYKMALLGGKTVRATTDRDLFERHGGSMEFWSPGSPAFPKPGKPSDTPKHKTLKQLLDSLERRR